MTRMLGSSLYFADHVPSRDTSSFLTSISSDYSIMRMRYYSTFNSKRGCKAAILTGLVMMNSIRSRIFSFEVSWPARELVNTLQILIHNIKTRTVKTLIAVLHQQLQNLCHNTLAINHYNFYADRLVLTSRTLIFCCVVPCFKRFLTASTASLGPFSCINITSESCWN